MHSSTSSSKPLVRHNLAIAGWVMVVAGVLAGSELVARAGYDRFSRIQSRTRQERAALSILKGPLNKPSLLMVGNSIMLEGVNFPEFQEALAPRVRSQRFIVEQTLYYDWYYGLKRLFAEGIRPTYLLIGFAAPHLNATYIRGDFSAHYLFDSAGIIDYSRLAALSLTETSNLLFAHYSGFYGVRSDIRAFLMYKLFPSYSADLYNLTLRRAEYDTDEHVAVVARGRLEALDTLCKVNGVKLIFVITPTGEPGENGIVAAGKSAGATVLMPVPRANLKPEDFADGFHLSASGRAIFTKALVEDLWRHLPPGRHAAYAQRLLF